VSGAIWTAHARVTDTAAMEKLLAPLPKDIAGDVRTLAAPAGYRKAGMRWSANLRRAYYLQHAGDGVLSCITFEEVPSAEKAAELWAAIDDHKGADMGTICRLYAAVLGVETEEVVRH
jgi:hypothetical protein